MEDRRKYIVGTDNATPETVRTEVVNDSAQYAASMWAKHKADVPYERVFWTNGMHVRVTIEKEDVEKVKE